MDSAPPLDYYNLPISIDDAASMFRRKIQKNDKPYTKEIIKLNNRKVDKWKRNVLQEICDGKGMVSSGRVWKSWQLFEEGKSIEKHMVLKEQGVIPEYSEEVVGFWKDFFENLTIEELHEYTPGVISSGWMILNIHMKNWFAEEKWNKLFSHDRKEVWWEKNHHSHKDLLDGKILPFWDIDQYIEINQKVGAILRNQINPPENLEEREVTIKELMSMMKRKVGKNDRPYIAETTLLNNKLVDRWKIEVLEKICDGKILLSEAWKSWGLYEEGKAVEKYLEIKEQDMFPEFSGEIVDFWKKLIENSTIEELHEYGSGVVSLGWKILQAYIKDWFVEEKWKKLFSLNKDGFWREKNQCLLDEEAHPFWNFEKYYEISEKVGTILGNPIKPQESGGFK